MPWIKDVFTVPFRISYMYSPPPSLPTLLDSGPVAKGVSVDLRSWSLFLSRVCLNSSLVPVPFPMYLLGESGHDQPSPSSVPLSTSRVFFAVFLTASVWMSFLSSMIAVSLLVPLCKWPGIPGELSSVHLHFFVLYSSCHASFNWSLIYWWSPDHVSVIPG